MDEGVPPLHTRITGIPRGRYEVELRIGRTLAVSLDGQNWEKRSDADRVLGVYQITDGTFEVWVDDRYVHAPNPGSAYFDYIKLTPVPDRVDKRPVTGFAASRVQESLDRGLAAVRTDGGGVFLSWRLLAKDPADIAFDVYRVAADGEPQRLNPAPLRDATCFLDQKAPRDMPWQYRVRPVLQGVAGEPSRSVQVAAFAVPGAPALSFQLDPGETVQKVGIGDLDGDGRYDFVLKTPAGQHRSRQHATGSPVPTPTISTPTRTTATGCGDTTVGWAIERGIWYSPMIVFDLDGDGRAEVAVKTGEGDPRGH